MKRRILFLLMLISSIFINSCGDDCKFETLLPDALPTAKLDSVYAEKIEQKSTCSYTSKFCEITKGVLPEGLTIDGNGDITGTPKKIGIYPFTIKFTVCFGTSAYGSTDCTEKTKEYTIVVDD